MKYFCRKWRAIGLKLAPTVFKRHIDNSSYYDQNEKVIHWTLEFKLIMLNNKNPETQTRTVLLPDVKNENLSVESIIEDFALDKTKYYSQNHLFLNEIKDKLLGYEKIEAYLEKRPAEEFKNLIVPKKPGTGEEVPVENEQTLAFDNKYDIEINNMKLCRVDKVRSLKEALENTVVCEYPTLYLLM